VALAESRNEGVGSAGKKKNENESSKRKGHRDEVENANQRDVCAPTSLY
jgi:hypothetical protein